MSKHLVSVSKRMFIEKSYRKNLGKDVTWNITIFPRPYSQDFFSLVKPLKSFLEDLKVERIVKPWGRG